MATIRERSGTYQIRVSCGYDLQGAQIVKTMTWKPEPKMTAKQIEKELQRQATLFEERVKNSHTTLDDFTQEVITRFGLSEQTVGFLNDTLKRLYDKLAKGEQNGNGKRT